MPKLLIKSGILQSQEFDLKLGISMIGRAAGNDLQINHPSVSGTHCEIHVDGSGIFVRDLGSTNGTFIDRQPVHEAEVQPGQILQFGAVELHVQPDAVEIEAPGRGGLRIAHAEVAAPAPPPVPTVTLGQANIRVPPPVEQPIVYGSFFQSLPSAFGYPLKRGGLFLLVTGTLFFALMDFLTTYSFGLASLVMGVIGYGYLAAYMQKIVVCSAEGEDTLPDWPEFSGWWDDIVHPALLLVGAFAASFGPAIAVWIFTDFDAALKLMLAISIGIFGCFYLPMALIAVSMYGSLMALNPLLIVPSMAKVVGPYLVACAMLAVLSAVKVGTTTLLQLFLPIPIVPALLAGFVSLYFVTAEMRVLGLLYFYKKDDLRWSF